MTKISFWFPAVLCVSLLVVACGGGGDDVSIPADAKICEIQRSTDMADQPQTSGLLDSDLGIQIMPTETGTRYNVSVEEKRPFYAYLSSQYSGGEYFTQGIVNSSFIVTAFQQHSVSFSNYFGTKNGVPVVGLSQYQVIGFGTKVAQIHVANDVTGIIEPPIYPSFLFPPRLVSLDRGLFQVENPLTAGGPPITRGTTIEFSVSRWCYHCGVNSTCRVTGLSPGDKIAIRGAEPGSTYEGSAEFVVILDSGEEAHSKSDSVMFDY